MSVEQTILSMDLDVDGNTGESDLFLLPKLSEDWSLFSLGGDVIPREADLSLMSYVMSIGIAWTLVPCRCRWNL